MPERSIRVVPATATGTVRAPPSKSVTHRAYVLAAQSDVPCTVLRPLRAADPDATLACLHALGARVAPGAGEVAFTPAPPVPPREVLDCRNAGTALRLLLALAARLPFPVTLDGDASLRGRPNGRLLHALEALGARTESRDGRAPVTVRGPMGPGSVTLPGGSSSQYASALLLSLPMLDGPSEMRLEPPVASAPYLDVTHDVAAAFGVASAAHDEDGARVTRIDGGRRPRAERYLVDGDWSAAAFPLVAAASGGPVTVRGLRADSPQGDRAILPLLRRFGLHVHVANDAVTARSEGATESPGTVDVRDTPDLFPALAILAAVSRGTTTFTGGAALRRKETDRIAAMAEGLAALGVRAEERPDGLVVHGARGGIQAGRVRSHGDHRIHMAFAVAGLLAEGPVDVDDPACAAVSYPSFHADLARLGGR